MWMLFLAVSIIGFVVSARASRIIDAFVERAGVKEELDASTFPPYNGKRTTAKYREFFAKHADDKAPLTRDRIGRLLCWVFALLAYFTSGLPRWLDRYHEDRRRRKRP
jgi:hypothetical protein